MYLDRIIKLNQLKDPIIKEVRAVDFKGFSNTQAQDFREHAMQTVSVQEILLYLDYQMARNINLRKPGAALRQLVVKYNPKGIDVIRYLMGTVVRQVTIQNTQLEV